MKYPVRTKFNLGFVQLMKMLEQMVLAIQLTMINVYLRYNVFQMAGNLSRFPAFLLPKNEDNV